MGHSAAMVSSDTALKDSRSLFFKILGKTSPWKMGWELSKEKLHILIFLWRKRIDIVYAPFFTKGVLQIIIQLYSSLESSCIRRNGFLQWYSTFITHSRTQPAGAIFARAHPVDSSSTSRYSKTLNRVQGSQLNRSLCISIRSIVYLSSILLEGQPRHAWDF